MHAGDEDHARTAWMDNIEYTWTVDESIRMTEERHKWRSTSMVWPTLGSRTAKEKKITVYLEASARRFASAVYVVGLWFCQCLSVCHKPVSYRSSVTAEGPRDALSQLTSCQLT